MPASAIFAAVTATATVASGYNSYKAGKAQQKYQEQQRQVQIRLDGLRMRQEKLNAYRERIRAQDEVTQTGLNTGTSGFTSSSGYQGGIASLDSQYASNQLFVNRMNGLINYGSNIVNKAGKYQSQASMFGSIASLAGDTFGGSAELANTTRSMFKN